MGMTNSNSEVARLVPTAANCGKSVVENKYVSLSKYVLCLKYAPSYKKSFSTCLRSETSLTFIQPLVLVIPDFTIAL